MKIRKNHYRVAKKQLRSRHNCTKHKKHYCWAVLLLTIGAFTDGFIIGYLICKLGRQKI